MRRPVTWLTADQAAHRLGVSVANVRVIAHRRKWRRTYIDTGTVAYHVDDIQAERERREALRILLGR